MDNMTDFINNAGKATQEQEVITGRHSDDSKFDLLDLIELGLWALAVVATLVSVIYFINYVSARSVM